MVCTKGVSCMKKKISAAILILFLIFNVTGQAFAETDAFQTVSEENAALDTFLYVITTWGRALAKITGSYDSLANIGKFSHFARSWHEFVGEGGFTPENIFRTILYILNLNFIFENGEYGGESYTL